MKTIYSSSPNTHRLRPPDLYEYSIDNYWFKTVGLEHQKINQPLRGSQTADVVIIGGGYMGLSSAYNIQRKFPEKKIVLLEGACCGYGASGRNGGFCVSTDLLRDFNINDPQLIQDRIEVAFYGQNAIKQMIADHGIDCDFQENGILHLAFSENQAKYWEGFHTDLQSIGLESTFLQREDLEAEIISPRAIAGQISHYGAHLNPAKLVRGMKRLVEEVGVEVLERTVVTRITTGKTILVDTELGNIRTPILVLGLNAYGNKLGLFKNRIVPMNTFIIATEPLSADQWESIGWQNRQALSDGRVYFNYSVPTIDGRIVMGGSDFFYYPNDGISSGNEKTVTHKLKKDLFTTFPQLEGLKIEHAWGGTTALTVDSTPSVGLLKGHDNIYYGCGYSQGVTTAQTAGRIIADLMAGESNIFTNHFIVDHKFPYAGPIGLRGFFIQTFARFKGRSD